MIFLCCVFQVQFTINQMVVSGVKVNRLDMYGEVGSQINHFLGYARNVQTYFRLDFIGHTFGIVMISVYQPKIILNYTPNSYLILAIKVKSHVQIAPVFRKKYVTEKYVWKSYSEGRDRGFSVEFNPPIL